MDVATYRARRMYDQETAGKQLTIATATALVYCVLDIALVSIPIGFRQFALEKAFGPYDSSLPLLRSIR